MSSATSHPAPGPSKFGTLGGVFIPNVLTILGVIMFLRTGWVVGNAGIKQALTILVIANAITFLTALSLSAIATNTKVGGGGAYFLISRSLGLEIGGAIGLPLFLAQAISVAFYIIGFVESLQFLFPAIDVQLAGTVVLAVLFIISWVGADLAVKTQYFILGALVLSLFAFFLGYHPVPDIEVNLAPAYAAGQNFWTVFAIFFPAVTGIMAGVSMSGDLKDPSRSIPRGTIWAVVVTFVIYAAQMIWLGMNAPREELIDNKLVMQKIALVPPLIFVGLWAATLSSALASLLAAPRTLQALGNDGVVPRILARGTGPANEPRVALILSLILAEACIMAGNLDLIAPVISMFFLTTYGMTNLVAGLEALVANPSYRPTFRVHWLLSILGFAGCLFVMFLLHVPATLGAILVSFGIYSALKRKQYQTAWGDFRSGLWFAVTRLGLLQLAQSRQHVRNWRPVLLVLAGNPKTRQTLVEFASGIEARRGLLFLAHIVTGPWQSLILKQPVLQRSLEEFIADNRLSAVAKVVLANDFEHGVSTLLQVSGVGALQPNTVLLGWSEDAVKQAEFARTIRHILELQRNLLIHVEAELPRADLARRIDIWWRARENGSLMLTLAHLLTQAPRWRDYTIRINRIIQDEAGREQADTSTRQMIADARIEAESNVIVSGEPPLEVIGRESEKAELCFVGIALQEVGEQENPLAIYTPLVTQLKGHIFLTKSWHDLEL